MNYIQKETNKKQYMIAFGSGVIGVIIVFSMQTILSAALAAVASSMIIGYLCGKADGYRKAAKEM